MTKAGYNEEAGKRNKKNDVAMALTVFIASMVTVYNDSPEPSEIALQNLYNILAESMSEDAAFLKTGNSNKELAHDTLVYISGLVLAGYELGRAQNDPNTVRSFRELAGVCLQSLLQLDPHKLSFDQNGLVVKP